MAREIEFLIICSEFNYAEHIVRQMKELAGVDFHHIEDLKNQIVCLDLLGLNIRRPLNEEVEQIVAAFKKIVFLEPEITTLFVYADDGSVMKRIPR